MDINLKVKPYLKIRAFYLGFIIFGLQTGVGIMGAPRFIFQGPEQDAWISILISYVMLILVFLCMFAILKQYPNADIFGIQIDVFGKVIGSLLGFVYIIFFMGGLLSVLLTYLNVIHIFMYPTLSPLVITGIILGLSIYCLYGGIRSIVGAAFLFSILPVWILYLLNDPISKMDWSHFLPMFQASIPELLEGARATSYTVIGLEILFVFYPFIKNKSKAVLSGILGISGTISVLLLATIISIGYFSPTELKQADWTTLTLFKSVSLPFIERLDYIVIVTWFLVILPNVIILIWTITFGLKRLINIQQKKTAYIIAGIIWILTGVIKYDHHIKGFTDVVSQVGFWMVFVYPFLLLPIVLIKKRWLRKKGRSSP